MAIIFAHSKLLYVISYLDEIRGESQASFKEWFLQIYFVAFEEYYFFIIYTGENTTGKLLFFYLSM